MRSSPALCQTLPDLGAISVSTQQIPLATAHSGDEGAGVHVQILKRSQSRDSQESLVEDQNLRCFGSFYLCIDVRVYRLLAPTWHCG